MYLVPFTDYENMQVACTQKRIRYDEGTHLHRRIAKELRWIAR